MSRDYAQPVGDQELATAKTALEANNFNVVIVDDLAAAKGFVVNKIPKGSDVFTGTSVTLDEAGLTDELNNSTLYDSAKNRYVPLMKEGRSLEAKQIGSASDWAVGSVHAITQDGQVLIASASGSQLPNYLYGANHVIWVAGAQKVVKDVQEGIDRIESYTLPLENQRAEKVYGEGSSIRKLVIYRNDKNPDRITIVLVKQAVGY